MSAEQMFRTIFKPAPQPEEWHPVRCPATNDAYSWDGERQHHHACIHPARREPGVVGLVEHQCQCGMTWIDLRTCMCPQIDVSGAGEEPRFVPGRRHPDCAAHDADTAS